MKGKVDENMTFLSPNTEIGKDLIDFLLGFLLLPTGVVMRILQEHSKMSSKEVESISNLYKSVEKMNATYMTLDKTLLIKPHESFICYNGLPRMEYATPPIYYACCNAHSYFNNKHQIYHSSRVDLCLWPWIDYSVVLSWSFLVFLFLFLCEFRSNA